MTPNLQVARKYKRSTHAGVTTQKTTQEIPTHVRVDIPSSLEAPEHHIPG